MIENLNRQDFTGPLPASLAVEHQGRRLDVEVLEVRDLPATTLREAPFAVLLAGPSSPVLPQSIHVLLHPTHGRLDVFMVPIGRDARHTRYEIIFN